MPDFPGLDGPFPNGRVLFARKEDAAIRLDPYRGPKALAAAVALRDDSR
jgi:hypothetical protein